MNRMKSSLPDSTYTITRHIRISKTALRIPAMPETVITTRCRPITNAGSASYYNSLQANYERRFSAGLSVLANFTWSKCRTDAVDVLNSTAISGRNAALLPGFGVQGDYGLCDFDIPKVVHVSGNYDLPFGQGRQFLNGAKGAVEAVLGGW